MTKEGVEVEFNLSANNYLLWFKSITIVLINPN